ncbi:hypothetical protein D3C73_748950 [compost metagenome]
MVLTADSYRKAKESKIISPYCLSWRQCPVESYGMGSGGEIKCRIRGINLFRCTAHIGKSNPLGVRNIQFTERTARVIAFDAAGIVVESVVKGSVKLYACCSARPIGSFQTFTRCYSPGIECRISTVCKLEAIVRANNFHGSCT